MNRFRFDQVAAGAALKQAAKTHGNAEVTGVVVDGDKKVAVDAAQDAFTKALQRIDDEVNLGGAKKAAPKQPPTRDQFDSDAAFTKALDRYERGQVWKAYKSEAATRLRQVGAAGGKMVRMTGLPTAGKFVGHQLHNAAAALGKTGPGRKMAFAKDVLLEVMVAAHPQRVQAQHQVEVQFADGPAQHYQVSVTDPAATLALHRSTLPAQVIATCPWFPFSGIVTCGAVSFRFFKLAKRARDDGDVALADALERTGRHMRGLAVAALGWVLAEPVYAAGTVAETMQRQAMRGSSVAVVEALDGPIIDVPGEADADPKTVRERMKGAWEGLQATFREAAERARASRAAHDAHFDAEHIDAALKVAGQAEDAANKALTELEIANRLDEAGLPDAAGHVREMSAEDREDASEALAKTNAELGELSDAMRQFLDTMPDPDRGLPNPERRQ